MPKNPAKEQQVMRQPTCTFPDLGSNFGLCRHGSSGSRLHCITAVAWGNYVFAVSRTSMWHRASRPGDLARPEKRVKICQDEEKPGLFTLSITLSMLSAVYSSEL
jgi:hypothetical protein